MFHVEQVDISVWRSAHDVSLRECFFKSSHFVSEARRCIVALKSVPRETVVGGLRSEENVARETESREMKTRQPGHCESLED